MLISKPRIDAELEKIEKELRAELQEIIRGMANDLKERVKLAQKKHKEDIEKKLEENNVDNSKFTTVVLLHVPTRKKLRELEDWIEANITNHVKIQAAIGLEYEDDLDDFSDSAVDFEEVYPDGNDVEEVKVDHYPNAYGKKDIYKHPTYEFSFVDPSDAVRFKLACC